ncbi:MAG TPA: hypothetical protein ENI91_06360, partial [Sphingomonadales bacterium]|nr:hypothetical protein [Sphingomonadales bacterium]
GGGGNGGGGNGGGGNGGGGNGGGGNNIVLFADAGPDKTIYSGMDIDFDGCAENSFSISVISLCDIQGALNPSEFDLLFDISWELQLEGGGTVSLGYDLVLFDVVGNNPGLFPLTGTDFPGLGSYIIKLVIDYNGNPFSYNGFTITNDGIPLKATDDMTLFIVNISAPPMLALFGLGWGFTAYQRRRKRKTPNP